MSDQVRGWQRPAGPDAYELLRDRAVVEAAVAERAARRQLRAEAVQSATLTGVLRDLAERGERCSIATSGSRVHHGRCVAVRIDHVAVRLAGGGLLLAPLVAIRTVRPEPGAVVRPAAGDRAADQDRTLAEALERIAETDAPVRVGLTDADDGYRGRLLGVGTDVLTLHLDGPGGAVHIALHAVSEVLVIG